MPCWRSTSAGGTAPSSSSSKSGKSRSISTRLCQCTCSCTRVAVAGRRITPTTAGSPPPGWKRGTNHHPRAAARLPLVLLAAQAGDGVLHRLWQRSLHVVRNGVLHALRAVQSRTILLLVHVQLHRRGVELVASARGSKTRRVSTTVRRPHALGVPTGREGTNRSACNPRGASRLQGLGGGSAGAFSSTRR